MLRRLSESRRKKQGENMLRERASVLGANPVTFKLSLLNCPKFTKISVLGIHSSVQKSKSRMFASKCPQSGDIESENKRIEKERIKHLRNDKTATSENMKSADHEFLKTTFVFKKS